ncbi:MAG: GNAT family N-acetyltransferase [Betaproteobacteria bacterium]
MIAPTCTFRAAKESDAACIGTLGIQVFLDTYATDGIRPSLVREVNGQFSPEAMLALMAQADTRIVLAERAAHLIGFAQWELHSPQPLLHGVDAAASAKLNRLYVQERFTGTGVGKALLAEAEAGAAREGATALWLTAWVGNARALAFYPRCGYRDIGATLYEFENEKHENRVFAKPLTA